MAQAIRVDSVHVTARRNCPRGQDYIGRNFKPRDRKNRRVERALYYQNKSCPERQ